MELVYVVVLCFASAFAGAFLTGRWYRADVQRYKDSYLKVADEKKNLIIEYGRRLDDFGRLIGGDRVTVHFSGIGEPPETCRDGSEETDDNYC